MASLQARLEGDQKALQAAKAELERQAVRCACPAFVLRRALPMPLPCSWWCSAAAAVLLRLIVLPVLPHMPALAAPSAAVPQGLLQQERDKCAAARQDCEAARRRVDELKLEVEQQRASDVQRALSLDQLRKYLEGAGKEVQNLQQRQQQSQRQQQQQPGPS